MDVQNWITLAARMDVKDWITLAASMSAFVFSIVSYSQKHSDARQAQRKQLTDLLKEIADMNLKADTFRALKDKSSYPPNYIGLLADQRRFLARQAASLTRAIPNLVGSFEFLLIAGAFQAIDYVEEAETFFEQAASQAKTLVEKGIAVRGYGRFLFDQLRLDEARAKFQTSINTFSNPNETVRFYQVDTYIRWAEHERDIGSGKARDLLERARVDATEFEHARRRSLLLERIDSVAKTLGDSKPPP
jgi:tetratricopeptide (TPR) repeat protein